MSSIQKHPSEHPPEHPPAAVDFLISVPQWKYRRPTRLFIGLLFLLGLLVWGSFFNWGRWSLTYHDWADITAPRLTILKQAAIRGQIPMHTANRLATGELKTTRFLAIPDLILSPQVLLLRYLSLNQFSLFQVGFLYTLGFLGLVQLRRILKWSLLTFTTVFFLYNFNGHILAHLSVGHLTWSGYFLFSWFAVWVFELLQGKAGWGWAARVSLLLFTLLLQGSFHQWLWLLLFIGLLGVFIPTYFRLLLGTAVLSVLLAMVRLLPGVSLLGGTPSTFIGGYPDVLSILNALVRMEFPGAVSSIGSLVGEIGLWEVTLYTGVVGAAFLLYFGLLRWLADPGADRRCRALFLPVLGLVFLSLERVFLLVRQILPLPIFTGERVSTRLISLSFVFLLFLAAIEFQKWLDSRGGDRLILGITLALGLFGIQDLFHNYSLWSLLNAAQAFKYKQLTPFRWSIANDPSDVAYVRLVLIGLAVTVASLVFILVQAWREKRARI